MVLVVGVGKENLVGWSFLTEFKVVGFDGVGFWFGSLCYNNKDDDAGEAN